MTTRPSMHARDSSGRKVSLLNDEPNRTSPYSLYDPMDLDIPRSRTDLSARSSTSSPVTPGLSRADSFDSNAHDPLSPLTPTVLLEFGRQTSYTGAGYKDQMQYDYREKMQAYEDYSSNGTSTRPAFTDNTTSAYPDPHFYDEEAYQTGNGNGSASERGPKRYPCRYRDTHNCQKTFTTSGHASRHSKIHTAEKGVSCTWEGCQKKFTRADNMKQHLETHTKERSRSSATSTSNSSKSNTPSVKTLSRNAGVKKAMPAILNRPTSRNAPADMSPVLDPALLQPPQSSFLPTYRTQNALDTLAFAADQTLRTRA